MRLWWGEQRGSGLTRSYLLLRTSDFSWVGASLLIPLDPREPDWFAPVSRRRTPAKQWAPYNCFYSSLNAKYSILFLLLQRFVLVRDHQRTDWVNTPTTRCGLILILKAEVPIRMRTSSIRIHGEYHNMNESIVPLFNVTSFFGSHFSDYRILSLLSFIFIILHNISTVNAL